MAKKPKDTDYIFLTAVIRAREPRLLTRESAERLLSSASPQDVIKQLEELGWDVSGATPATLDAALAAMRRQEFADLEAVCPCKGLVQVFRLRYDYHNLKVLLKSETTSHTREEAMALLSDMGRFPADRLARDYYADDLRDYPAVFSAAAAEAKDSLARTGDPQLADVLLDRACYSEFISMAQATGSRFLQDYAALTADSANLRITVRTRRMGRDDAFLERMLLAGGTLSPKKLLEELEKETPLSEIFPASLKEAAAAGEAALAGGRLTDFEKHCDNALADYLEGDRFIGFDERVVVRYLCSLENQISAVRIILAGVSAGLSPDQIRERLRDPYV